MALAKGYPYLIPATAYVCQAGSWRPLPGGVPAALTEGRTAVMALGSNRSPEQLTRKFCTGYGAVAVSLARIGGFDVVYSAHVSRYGAVPATIHPAPGVTAEVSVTWLDDRQLARMHETEAVGVNYDYGVFTGIVLTLDDGGVLDSVYSYVGRRGALRHDGEPVAMAEAAAGGRIFAARDQIGVQSLVRDRVAAGQDLDAMIAGHAADADSRQRTTAAISADAVPFVFGGFRVLDF